MFSRLFATEDDWTWTVLRIVFGLVVFAHGAQKMLGWFGGRGFAGYMTYLEQVRHIPGFFAVLAIFAEFFGSLALLAGFLSRVAALGIAANMAVAISLVHVHFGFFMNWNTAKKGEGMEFCILAILLALIVMVKGSGAWSLDRAAWRRMRSPRAAPALRGVGLLPAGPGGRRENQPC